MNRSVFILFLCILSACSSDVSFIPEEKEDGECTLTFTLQLPEATASGSRASDDDNSATASYKYSDGTTATELLWALYEVHDDVIVVRDSGTATMADLRATVAVTLVHGYTYNILFWAQAPDAPYLFNIESGTVSVDYSDAVSNSEARDAFFACEKGVTSNSGDKTVTLYRPFAQLNIGALDYEKAVNHGFIASLTSVKVSVFETLNLVTGEVSNQAERSFHRAPIPVNEEFPVTLDDATIKYLSMNYLLVNDKITTTVTFTVRNSDSTISELKTYTNVPLQRNYRTNIYGNVLTSVSTYTIEISPNFNDTDYVNGNDGEGDYTGGPA